MLKLFVVFLSFFISLSASANENNIKKSLELLKTRLTSLGEPKIMGVEKVGFKDAPILYFGDKKINNNFSVVDEVTKEAGGTATVFVKNKDEFIRISTNVLNSEGKRGVGTLLAKSKAYDSIIKGEIYCGEVSILGSKYNTCYEPIKNGNEILGVYYFGYKK